MTRAVIVDTDIGTDIDDTWALAMLLASPELDLKLITCVSGDVRYRAGLCARLLTIAGRRNVAIGLGIGGALKLTATLSGAPQSGFVGNNDLDVYPNVRADGVDAMIQTIMAAAEPVTVIAIGPLTNVAEALRRCPQIVERASFIGMHGSVRIGYRGAATPAAEYNVVADVVAAQRVLSAGWETTITPLDSCGSVVLRDAAYRQFHEFACAHPASMARAVLDNYRLWLDAVGAPAERATQRSTTLYDTVAVYLAISEHALRMETLPIAVGDDGFTRIDPNGTPMRVATGWRDAGAFDALLLDRVCW
jgi:inosine-uridine nucleoside N-ribohydrolase